ncbi:MAG: hypothetical protein ACOY94_09595 [Bacillota bacterium]
MTREELGWWGERWLSYLQGELGVGPESDGQVKSAHRAEGQVRIQKGRVAARVWVSERKQVEATLRVRPWTEREWRRATEAMAASPELAQRVLSGTLGAELEEALAALGQPLFPAPGPGAARCTCAGSGSCRHLNYLAVQTAELLDANPFLWLEVLGRGRAELLAEVKGRLSDKATPSASVAGEVALTAPDAGEPLDPARFWKTGADPAAVRARPGSTAAPDALLRSLGPLPVEEALYLLPSREEVRVDEVLRRMVVRVARTATALSLGELEPAYRPSVVMGKTVSLAARLAHEAGEALRAEDAVLLIDDLYPRCPTAVALGDEEAARKPLREACALLPPDLITVAGRYAGPAAALLREAEFHHVVTLDEWVEGEASSDADWVRALAAANRPRPMLAPWFERLEPEVGDALIIRPSESGVSVSLQRRAERDLTAPLHSDAVASRLLQVVTGMASSLSLSEGEAVATLLAEGAYRDDLHPDPLWLVPLLGPGLYLDPAERAVTRQPNHWRPGFARFVYGVWSGRDAAVAGFQAHLAGRATSRREVDETLATVAWWGRLWPGPQDQESGAESLGPFLHFLWNVAPREAARHRIEPGLVPEAMARWFAFLEERYPRATGAFTRHRLACTLGEHYADRCRTAPPEGAGEGTVLAWQAEGFRWMGPAHYLSGGSYR